MGLEEAMSPRSCSITWHSFSPWHNLSKLSSAHGLPKELLLVVKVVQVVFYVSTSNHSIFQKNLISLENCDFQPIISLENCDFQRIISLENFFFALFAPEIQVITHHHVLQKNHRPLFIRMGFSRHAQTYSTSRSTTGGQVLCCAPFGPAIQKLRRDQF